MFKQALFSMMAGLVLSSSALAVEICQISADSCFENRLFHEVQIYNKDHKSTSSFDDRGFNKKLSYMSHLLNNQGNDLRHLFVRNLVIDWDSMIPYQGKMLVPFKINVRWSKDGLVNQGTMIGKGHLVMKMEGAGKLSPDPETIMISQVSDSQSLEYFARALYFEKLAGNKNSLEKKTLQFLNRIVSLVMIDQIAKNPKILASPNETSDIVQVRMPHYHQLNLSSGT